MHRVVGVRSVAARARRIGRARAQAECLGYRLQVEDLGMGHQRVVLIDPCCGRAWAFDQLRQLERFLRAVEHWFMKLVDLGVTVKCAATHTRAPT